MKKEVLPIGTVLILNDGTKKVMITGYASKGEDNDRVYDYSGCIFPEGIMESKYVLFDNEQINEVFFMGFQNPDGEEYLDKVSSILTKREDLNALVNGKRKPESEGPKHGRVPKPAKHPISGDEMWAKYAVTKKSGPQNFEE